ncbi:MAG TPA: pseudouridine synthase [Ignavibacteriaceae bacterium]|nr:pseudouridine synthase [Ignavibacteriaceae bacterium]
MAAHKYYIINKPYNVLSQFTDDSGKQTLSSFYKFPKDVYPIGRLDYDSEGLLILTNDKKLNSYLLNPYNKHEREYYVQVEGIPTKESLEQFEKGIIIQYYKTLPAKAKIIEEPKLWERSTPIRFRQNIPTTWLSIILYEGKNRQVRKMTAAIGHPTLRLVRVRIKNILLGNLQPGEVRELREEEVKRLLM